MINASINNSDLGNNAASFGDRDEASKIGYEQAAMERSATDRGDTTAKVTTSTAEEYPTADES